jgi:hypothetical protein
MAKSQYSADSARLFHPSVSSSRPLPASDCGGLMLPRRLAPGSVSRSRLNHPRAA